MHPPCDPERSTFRVTFYGFTTGISTSLGRKTAGRKRCPGYGSGHTGENQSHE